MKRIIIFSLLLGSLQLYAQQDPMYGQYIFNNAIINPAQAGVQELNQVGILSRRQWLGMDGAPTTNTVFVNARLPKNLGIAGGIYNDRIGPVRDLTLQADLARICYMTTGIRTSPAPARRWGTPHRRAVSRRAHTHHHNHPVITRHS